MQTQFIRAVLGLSLLVMAGCATSTRPARLAPETASTMAPHERRLHLLDYEANPSRWSEEDLLAIGVFYHMEEKLPEAVKALLRYVQSHPTNIVANRNLGTIYMRQENYPGACERYEQAYLSGDKHSTGPLAAAFLLTGQTCRIGILVPDLLHARNDADIETRLSIVKTLVAYVAVCKTSDRKLFQDAMKGIRHEQILAHEDLTALVVACYEAFGDAEQLQALQAAKALKPK